MITRINISSFGIDNITTTQVEVSLRISFLYYTFIFYFFIFYHFKHEITFNIMNYIAIIKTHTLLDNATLNKNC
jgi:hypothetical protein